jgi:LysR family transcriptional activator of nhaA
MTRMTWLNYHHLFYFHAIAHQGSIAKASRTLRLGQSALSIQLKQLEEAFGARLFDRKGQRLALTPIGQTVLEYADAIFKLGTEMVETVKERRSTSKVRLDVGVLDGVPKSVAHRLVASAIDAGNCYVSVTEAGVDELLQGLLAHRLHLILTDSHAPIAPSSELFSRCVGDLSVVVCGAPKFARLARGFPGSLDGKPFLLPGPQSKLRNDLDHFFSSVGVRPDLVGESQESELDKRLALSGHALIVSSRHGVKTQLAEGKLVSIGTLESVREQIWLTGVRRHVANPIAAELLKTFTVR